MEENGKSKFLYWILGIFTGVAVTAPITAVVTKKICDKETDRKVSLAYNQGQNSGMNTMAEYVISEELDKTNHGSAVKSAPQEISDPETTVTEDDINRAIDEMNAMTAEDEEAEQRAREKSLEHARYLDLIEKYGESALPIAIHIDQDRWENESYMEKSNVNWYEEDNVFEIDLEVVDDPYAAFGVVDGRDLFKDTDVREDPDIVYIRNEKRLTDYEISRIHGSYAKLVGGATNINGQTDS